MNQFTPGRTVASKPILNAGQQAAADGFFQFLFSDEKEMSISGPGGVGKTFLMGQLIDQIMPRYFDTCTLMNIPRQYDEVIMTATTNKAAEQLSQATGRPCATIQSTINLKVQDDFSTGQSKLIKKNTWQVYEKKILFVDECSMEDTPLYGHIHEATQNCKIVHIGDHCQLAPVMETLSPVYRKNMPFFELTEPMRTGVPELQALNQQLRTTVETGVFNPIHIVPGIIDFADDAMMQAEIAKHFSQQTMDYKILAYTNQRVTQYNDHIRALRNLPSHYTVGELLVVASPVHLKGGMINTEQEVEITQLSSKSTMVPIESGVDLEVVYATLKTPIGKIFEKVPLPVDRNHFNALIKYYQKLKNWERYYFLKNYHADLRPHDASTVYKAQGSTYNTVFIDLANISTCTNPNQAARMLYVACSRPRHRIVFYGELAPRFGGLIR